MSLFPSDDFNRAMKSLSEAMDGLSRATQSEDFDFGGLTFRQSGSWSQIKTEDFTILPTPHERKVEVEGGDTVKVVLSCKARVNEWGQVEAKDFELTTIHKGKVVSKTTFEGDKNNVR